MLRRTGMRHLEDSEDVDDYWVEQEAELPRDVEKDPRQLATHNCHVHFRLQRLQVGDSYRFLPCLPCSRVTYSYNERKSKTSISKEV